MRADCSTFTPARAGFTRVSRVPPCKRLGAVKRVRGHGDVVRVL